MTSKTKDNSLEALKYAPLITSVLVLLLVVGESFNLFRSGIFDKMLEYIQALGR